MKIKYIVYAAALAMMASCSGPKGWTVEGNLTGVEKGRKIAVEALNNGNWYAIDSVAVGADGKFKYTSDAPAARPEVFRLNLPGGALCFPVDSTDVVTVKPGANGYTLSGTYLATMVSRVDSVMADAHVRKLAHDDASLRQALVGYIINDTTGLVAYYTLGKTIGNRLIFDPAESMGNRVYGAAAQVFATHNPGDPRGELLKSAYMQGRVALGKVDLSNLPERTIEANESGLIDVVRYDDMGVKHSLADVAAENKVVLLNFTAYGMDNSPELNIILNQLYTLYKNKGFEIYQIAFDPEEVEWKTSARNLPWITVWNSLADGDEVLANYNVGAIPMSFIISNGEIAKRVPNPADLPAQVGKYF